MARKTVVVSDLSGNAIEEGRAAVISIKFDDARNHCAELAALLPGVADPILRFQAPMMSGWTETLAGNPQGAVAPLEETLRQIQGVQDTSTNAGGILIHVVPPEYNDVTTTPLTQTVASSSSPQHFLFDISSKKKK